MGKQGKYMRKRSLPLSGRWLGLDESIMNHASHLFLSVHAIIRSAHMLILKRHMNITIYLTVHRTQNTIQTYRKVAGTNGNLTASENIWADTPYAIQVMTLYSLDPKSQKSVLPNHWQRTKQSNLRAPFSIAGFIKCILTICQYGEWLERCSHKQITLRAKRRMILLD